MPGRVFLDSNIFVYAQDAGSPDKQRKSREAVAALVRSGDGVISTQVMHEFYVTATGKIGVPPLVAKGVLKTFAVSRSCRCRRRPGPPRPRSKGPNRSPISPVVARAWRGAGRGEVCSSPSRISATR